MDIPFKKIELEDKELIDRYLVKKTYQSCELIFANIYLWKRFYPTEFAVVEDTLIFRSYYENDRMSITFPVGEESQIKKALDILFDYFAEKNMPIRMHLVQEQEFALLEQWYPGRFSIEYDRDAADYVYETEKLITLAGKKLHGKRNHINNFKKQYPDWSYERITEDNQEDCFQMAMKWRKGHICEHSGEKQDEEKRDELCVALNALRLIKELELVGGLLRVDGEVVAFAIGEPLNQDTFVVHIEKAFADIQGAYPMINQQFVEHEAQNFKYVNREEDTGSEGLRKAKLSYYPAFLVNKGLVFEKKEETDMTKIDIISGFLGAGKTTFIKKMLEEVFQGEKIVLIENEFGEIGIDGGFLRDSGIEISEMNSGCICCSLVGDFGRNLREVLERFAPDRILIEPSGVGKLSDVMKSVKDVEEEQDVKLNGLITVVNSLKAMKQMRAFGEFFNNQIEYATTVVLSRTQKAAPEQLEMVVKAIREKNPKAAIITTPWDEINGQQIYKLIEQQKSLEEELLEEHKHHHEHCHHEHHHGDHDASCTCGCHDHEHEHHHGDHDASCTCGCHDHEHEHHGHEGHHHADEVFTSWGAETPHKFTKEVIERAMKLFCDTEEYGVILRAKGMVPSEEGPWIYFDMVDGEYELRTGEPDYTGRLCVIGTDMEEDKLAELFGIV